MTARLVRRWEARAPQAAVDAWLVGFNEKVRPRMESIDGCSGVSVQVSDGDDPRTIVVLTYWASPKAMAEFVGEESDIAVIPDWVAEILPDHDRFATHYHEVLREDWR